MKLSQVAKALKEANGPAKTHSFLIYGPPKTGKTELVATIANAPEFERVFWFDTENGIDTLIRMHNDGKLTDEAMEKIVYIKIPDTREDPIACETMLKSFSTKQAVTICEEHGRVACASCKSAGKPSINFDYRKLTRRDAVVVDSLSQVGQSSMNMACYGKPSEYKLGYDEYGASGKWLHDILTVFQAAAYCHIFCITHVQIMEDENKSDIYYPLCGTKNFSANTAKYFGTVIFVTKKLKKHRAESSTLSSMNTLAGSRIGIVLEKSEMDLGAALREVGFLGKEGAQVPSETTKVVEEASDPKLEERPVAKAGGFASRVAASKP